MTVMMMMMIYTPSVNDKRNSGDVLVVEEKQQQQMNLTVIKMMQILTKDLQQQVIVQVQHTMMRTKKPLFLLLNHLMSMTIMMKAMMIKMKILPHPSKKYQRRRKDLH